MASSSPSSSNPNPVKGPGGTGFPTGAAVAALCATALLLGWHFWKHAPGHGGGLAPGIFQQAFSLPSGKKPAVKVARTPLNGVQATPNSPGPQPKPGTLPDISPVLVDNSGALDPFFAALWQLEQARRVPAPGVAPQSGSAGPTHADEKPVVPSEAPVSTGASVVTVLHYGDSPTTADLITGDTRALLQARFGDAGHGFNLPGKPWAWYGHRDVTISDDGWKSLTPVGSMREGIYGLGGATLIGGVGAKSKLKLADASQTEVELSYLDEPGGGSFSVSADGAALQTIPTDGSADTPAWTTLKLPVGTKEVELAVTSGTVKMLGVDFRKGPNGVLYDSLGLNGATTSVMARGFGKGTWPAELQHARPALVVINYGTNESSFGTFVADTTRGYENELRLAVAKVRSALPDVPILIMSPMDRGERAGLNDIETMATIPQIVAIQKRVAADLHCAFFDTYDAMGGEGTMSDWYTGKPRLVSADLIHPTPQGALIVAKELVDNLDLGYDRWKRMHGIVLAAAAPVSAAGAPKAQAKSPEPKEAGRPEAKDESRPASADQPKTTKGAVPDLAAPDRASQTSQDTHIGEAQSAENPDGSKAEEPKSPGRVAPRPTRLKTPDAKTPDTNPR